MLVVPDDAGIGAEVDAEIPEVDATDTATDTGKPKPPFKAVSVGTPSFVVLGVSIVAIATGDIDGDGKSDIAALDAADHVHVLLGKGDGTFATDVKSPAPAGGSAIALGDVDGDGKTDLVIAVPAAGKVSVASGKGTASFSFTTDLDSGAGTRAIALADMNSDSVLDIVFAAYDAKLVGVHRHEAAGWKKSTFALETKPWALAVADCDNDKHPDVITHNHALPVFGSPMGSYLAGDGTGGFAWTKPTEVATDGFPPDTFGSIAAADYDHDGFVDFADTSGIGGVDDAYSNYTINLGTGHLPFELLANFLYGETAHPAKIAQLAFVDLGGIGVPHLLVIDTIHTDVSGWSSCGGTCGESLVHVELGAPSVALASADFTGDAKTDLVIALANGRLALIPNTTK